MAAPKKEKRKPTTIHLSIPNGKKLAKMAKKAGQSGSDFINKLIEREQVK